MTSHAEQQPTLRRAVLGLQSAYFLVTGIWPLLHRGSFEAVTGRKRDFWLVHAVGVCVASIGAVLALNAAQPRTPAGSTYPLAGLSAFGLGAVEVVHVLRGRISRVYGADAVIEAAFVANALSGLLEQPDDRDWPRQRE